MKILFLSNYYYPYVSGVSEFLRIVAEYFATAGSEVTVLTANHAKLPEREVINGVNIIRTSVLFKISKGTVSPSFITKSISMSKKVDIVVFSMPMLESGFISLFIDNKKAISIYHCDIYLKPIFLNKVITAVMDLSSNACLSRVSKILTITKEYGLFSRVMNKYSKKLFGVGTVIKPLVPVPKEVKAYKNIGFCGRITEEKGIFVLLDAFKKISAGANNVKLLICGNYTSVAGGSIYPQLKDYIELKCIENVTFLGSLPEEEMSGFYSSLDVLVLPSINSMEAFGMVQIEAMYCGTPVVASNLPGVRTIVQSTGMGLISDVGDADSLAGCIAEILENPDKYIKKPEVIRAAYNTEKTMSNINECFMDVVKSNGGNLV